MATAVALGEPMRCSPLGNSKDVEAANGIQIINRITNRSINHDDNRLLDRATAAKISVTADAE